MTGQGDDLWATGGGFIQDLLGVAFADRLPRRVRVADDGLGHQRGAAGWTGRWSPPTTALMGMSRTCSVTPRICSIRGWPQPLISTRPNPATLTTRACSVMYPSQNSIRGSDGSTARPGPITVGPAVTATSAVGGAYGWARGLAPRVAPAGRRRS